MLKQTPALFTESTITIQLPNICQPSARCSAINTSGPGGGTARGSGAGAYAWPGSSTKVSAELSRGSGGAAAPGDALLHRGSSPASGGTWEAPRRGLEAPQKGQGAEGCTGAAAMLSQAWPGGIRICPQRHCCPQSLSEPGDGAPRHVAENAPQRARAGDPGEQICERRGVLAQLSKTHLWSETARAVRGGLPCRRESRETIAWAGGSAPQVCTPWWQGAVPRASSSCTYSPGVTPCCLTPLGGDALWLKGCLCFPTSYG